MYFEIKVGPFLCRFGVQKHVISENRLFSENVHFVFSTFCKKVYTQKNGISGPFWRSFWTPKMDLFFGHKQGLPGV